MNSLDAYKLRTKEDAQSFLLYMASRAARRGDGDAEATMRKRANELDLEIRAIRAGRP